MICGHVSFIDANSVNVTPPQDTPMSNRRDGKFIDFGYDVEIQKPIEKLPRGKFKMMPLFLQSCTRPFTMTTSLHGQTSISVLGFCGFKSLIWYYEKTRDKLILK